MEPVIKVHVHGPAGTIILNRPEKRNALSRELIAELKQALSDLHQERRVRAVIVTGAGSAFCAGMDLSEMAATSKLDDPQTQWHQDALDYLELIQDMLLFPKPLIAAVVGPALAGGAGLALACDIVVAGESAKFGLPEPRRGLVAGIVAPLLAFRVGAGRAGYLLLTAATITATEAQACGLAHEIIADDKVWARARKSPNRAPPSAPSRCSSPSDCSTKRSASGWAPSSRSAPRPALRPGPPKRRPRASPPFWKSASRSGSDALPLPAPSLFQGEGFAHGPLSLSGRGLG